MKTARSLIHTWLVLDFFGDARRRGGNSSTLTTTIFTQAFLALVFAALLYPETPPVPFAAANLSLSSLLIAVGMLSDHDRVDRRRADHVLIGTSPARRSSVICARAGHSAFYVCLLTTGMALPPAILLGFLQSSFLVAASYVALACVCSGLSTAVLAVVMRLLSRCFGHARAALLGGSLKALLLGAGIALFALGLQHLRGTADELPIGRIGAELLPTYQAARLLADPAAEWWRGAALLAAGAILALLALAISEDENATGGRQRPAGPLRWLLLRLAGRGPGAGLAEFTATTMWRSAGFRARVLPLLGLPAGMIYLSLRDGENEQAFVFLCLLLQLPAIYLPFLIAFLPRADQDNTRWVFDQAPPLSIELVRDAVWRALVTHVLVPVHGIALVLLVATSPAPLDAAVASVFSFAIAVLVSRPMCGALAGIPFTDDSGAEPAADLGSLFPFALLLLGLAIGFGAFATPLVRGLAAAGAIAIAVGLLRQRPAQAAVRSPYRLRASRDPRLPEHLKSLPFKGIVTQNCWPAAPCAPNCAPLRCSTSRFRSCRSWSERPSRPDAACPGGPEVLAWGRSSARNCPMNTHTEVDSSAGERVAGTAAVRERDQAKDADQGDLRSGSPGENGRTERFSVDPLRATDRYRLVAPLDLRF